MERGDAPKIDRVLGFHSKGERARAFCRPPRAEDPDHNTGETSPFARYLDAPDDAKAQTSCAAYVAARCDVRPEGGGVLIFELGCRRRIADAMRKGIPPDSSRQFLADLVLDAAVCATRKLLDASAPDEECVETLARAGGVLVRAVYAISPEGDLPPAQAVILKAA